MGSLVRAAFGCERIKNIKVAHCLNSQRMLCKWGVFHMSELGGGSRVRLLSWASIFMGVDHHGLGASRKRVRSGHMRHDRATASLDQGSSSSICRGERLRVEGLAGEQIAVERIGARMMRCRRRWLRGKVEPGPPPASDRRSARSPPDARRAFHRARAEHGGPPHARPFGPIRPWIGRGAARRADRVAAAGMGRAAGQCAAGANGGRGQGTRQRRGQGHDHGQSRVQVFSMAVSCERTMWSMIARPRVFSRKGTRR